MTCWVQKENIKSYQHNMENQDYIPFGKEWKEEMGKHPKAFIVDRLASVSKKLKEFEGIEDQHQEELGNKNSYAAADMENRHDKAMVFLVERITNQRDIAVAMMGDGARQAVIAYNYAITMIVGLTLDDF
jgi:hypothetical protein